MMRKGTAMGRRRPKSSRRAAGMTLLEVLIATALLAVGVAGMISIQILAMRDEAIAREDNEASRISRDTLEQIQRLPFTQVLATGGGWADPAFVTHAGYPVGQVPVQIQTPGGGTEDQGVYAVTWRISNVVGQSSLRNVDIQIGWVDAVGRNQVYTASTLKYNP